MAQHPAAESPRGRRAGAALVAIALLWLAHTLLFRAYLTDDAFISFRYLANLAAGHGLVYNPGERVWGFSNFLWMALLFPWTALGGDPLLAARALGVLCSAGCLLRVAAGLPGGRRPNPWGAALLACSGAFVLQAWGGLETSLFTLLVLWALAAQARAAECADARALRRAGFVAALAALTRPEGIVVGLVLARGGARCGDSAGRALASFALGFVPLFALVQGALWLYYGAPWPNSIDAKVGLSGEQLARGLHYAIVFAAHLPAHVALLVAGALRWRRAAAGERRALELAAALIVLAIGAGGDWMLGYRFFHAPMALGCLLAPLALAGLGRRGTAVAVLACALTVLDTPLDQRVTRAASQTYVHDGIRVGRWMRENLPRDALLATNTGGSVAYYSRLAIVDMMGINDRVIAAREGVPDGWRGIEKGDGRYVLEREPDFVQFGSSLGAVLPVHLSDIELYRSEAFQRRYELLEAEIAPGTKLRLYRRRAQPRAEPVPPERRAAIERAAAEALRRSAFRY